MSGCVVRDGGDGGSDDYSAGRKVFSGMYLDLTKVSPLGEKKTQNLETEFDSGHFLGTAG